MRSGVHGGSKVISTSTPDTPSTAPTAFSTHPGISPATGQPGAVNVDSYSRVTSPKPLIYQRAAPRPWKLWQPSFMMVALIVIGTAVACAHHIAYRYLDGKYVSIFSQFWARNLANAAAFLVKSCFTMATGLAFQEVLWQSLRRRLTKIGSIDKLFTVQTNPLNFLTADGFRTAPIALLLAAIAWTIPLAAIITPGTLGIESVTSLRDSSCAVPSFAGGDHSTIFYQTGPSGDYVGSSQEIRKTAIQAIPKGEVLFFASPCGSNCSFTEEFFGPALKCVDQENPSSLADTKKWTYYTSSVATEENTPLTIQLSYNNYYASNKSRIPAESTPDEISRTLLCTAYNATYKLNATFTNGAPLFITTITDFHDPILVIRDAFRFRLNCGDRDCPSVNFFTLVSSVFGYLTGTVERDSEDNISSNSEIQTTTLAKAGKWEVLRDFATAVPELMTNLTVSTISFTGKKQDTTCTAIAVNPAYIYNPLWLVMPYGIALALALLALVLGTYALQSTGVASGNIFSQILVTTRNPALDELAAGAGLSSSDAKWVLGQRIRLGELRSEINSEDVAGGAEEHGGSGHAAFGMQGQTLTLRKGRTYR